MKYFLKWFGIWLLILTAIISFRLYRQVIDEGIDFFISTRYLVVIAGALIISFLFTFLKVIYIPWRKRRFYKYFTSRYQTINNEEHIEVLHNNLKIRLSLDAVLQASQNNAYYETIYIRTEINPNLPPQVIERIRLSFPTTVIDEKRFASKTITRNHISMKRIEREMLKLYDEVTTIINNRTVS